MSRRILAAFVCVVALSGQTLSDLKRGLANPPDDARIMMRWWWFGTDVSKPELERELRLMKEGGIGGVEIQPVYPLDLDDPKTGHRNIPYLSDDFLDALKFTSAKTRELGLRLDLTLCSGWPYGGPHIPVTEAAGKLRVDRIPVPAGASSVKAPAISTGEQFLAAFLVKGDGKTFEPDGIARLSNFQLPKDLAGRYTVLAFIASRTGQQVKRAALNSEGFVLDHYDRNAVEHHLKAVGDRLMQAFTGNPPYAVFSDSLEVFGSDWTGDLPEEFRKRRGYDLIPLLPALVGDIGPRTADVRHDWGQTLTELGEERYLTPVREWAHKNNTKFRSQTYGVPPVILSSNDLVDLPEGEHGNEWRRFSVARWAASAAHLYNRPVVSTETWTWLHSPAFRATPLDMKAEADLHFLQGINQLIGHGWPYSPESAGEPGYRFYAAAVFNSHNPWYIVMPDVSRYLQRMSYLMRQGKAANDVAVYLPTDDAWAGFTAGKDSVDRSLETMLSPTLLPAILDAGYNLDFIDDRAMEKVGIPYPVLVLPKHKRMPPATAKRIEEYKSKGGIVVEEDRLAELPQRYQPDFATATPAIGFIHRKLADSDVYFIANTGNRAVHTQAKVRMTGKRAEWWDPFTGVSTPAGEGPFALDLEPYESRLLVFSAGAPVPKPASTTSAVAMDITAGWKLTVPKGGEFQMPASQSWTDTKELKYYSGIASYEKTIDISADLLKSSALYLDFGQGTPVPSPDGRKPGMRALLESPVREAAVVSVNGVAVGPVWRPPYEVEVTKALHAGANNIRIVVGNLAINSLAGESLPDYKLLNVRYGERFTPQDMDRLEPLPSGILGGVRVLIRNPSK
jgi:hypothetical protein